MEKIIYRIQKIHITQLITIYKRFIYDNQSQLLKDSDDFTNHNNKKIQSYLFNHRSKRFI